jgi:hypothetical protein
VADRDEARQAARLRRRERADGSRRTFIGLPGNPVSSFVTFLLAVRPVLLHLQGANAAAARRHAARRLRLAAPDKRREFLRVRATSAAAGPVPNQSSGVLTSAVWGDGWSTTRPGRPSAAATRDATCRFPSCCMKLTVRYFASIREALGPAKRSSCPTARRWPTARPADRRSPKHAAALARGRRCAAR